MEELLKFVEYINGDLYWKKRPANHIHVGDKAGCVDSRGYLCIGFRGKLYRVHRVIYFMHHGELPEMVDHVDGDRLNNKIENLRAATNQENLRNMKSRGGSSGFKGVSYRARNKFRKYEAQIMVDRKYKHLGSFVSEEEAAHAYDAAALELFGNFANLNFPQGN